MPDTSVSASLPFPRPGSGLQHALRLTPSDRRQALACWVAWWHETARIPFEVTDPGVAETKLRWWLAELQRSAEGLAQHPLMKQRLNARIADGARWPEPQLWAQQVEGLIQLVHQNRWLEEAQFLAHARQTTGLACEGAACLMGATSEGARSAARELGTGLRLAHRLSRLGQDARAGWVQVGIDLLQAHDVKAHQLTRPTRGAAPAGWQALQQDLAQRARQPLENGLSGIASLDPGSRRALRPLVALAHQALAQLDVVALAGDAILHERVLLTPWRKVWIAQRVAWGWLR